MSDFTRDRVFIRRKPISDKFMRNLLRRLSRCCFRIFTGKYCSVACMATSILYLLINISCFVFYPPPISAKLWLRNSSVDLEKILDMNLSKTWVNFFSSNSEDVDFFRSTRQSIFSKRGINCRAMFQNKYEEINRAQEYMDENRPEVWMADDYGNLAKNCTDFRIKRGYLPRPESGQEAEFPIAFSILMYQDVQMVERLLRAIYVPQNYYCIHVDAKADPKDREAMAAITNCFENVFIASKTVDVYWGHISIMYAEMGCLEELLRYKWKYFINLSGMMFPTHSNAELVEILKLYEGANDIEGRSASSADSDDPFRQSFSWRHWNNLNLNVMTFRRKDKPPHNITIYKGSNQVVITREFAVYFLYSEISQDIVEWFSDTLAPDEYIWPTLNHNPHLQAPGSYRGDPETKPFISRASVWDPWARQIAWSWKNWECHGRWVRMICIFGVGDLPWLYQRPELFVNKFNMDFHWLAYDCMEELIFNRTVESVKSVNMIGRNQFNLTYYLNLPFVKSKSLVTSPNASLSISEY